MVEKKNGKIKKKKVKKMPESQVTNTERKENEKKTTKSVPTYLVVLFVIAGILLGIALGIALQPSNPQPPVIIQPPDDGPKPAEKIRVTLLYDPACTFCEKYNTILDVFTNNFAVPYEVTEVSIESPEGIKALAQYNVKILPTALVEMVDVTKYSALKDAMDESFGNNRIDGKYVVPEFNLNPTKIYSREYLQPPIEEDCNVNTDKVRVNIFDNPFHEISLNLKPELDNALDKFDSNAINIRFEYLPTTAMTINLDQNNEKDFERNIGYLECASQFNKFREMHDAIIGQYCDINNDPKDTKVEEISFCNLSKNFGKPVPAEQMENIRNDLGIEQDLLETCVRLFKESTATSLDRAIDYSIRTPSTAVVQCKYNVPFKAIDEAVCLVNPQLLECQTENPNEDTNSTQSP